MKTIADLLGSLALVGGRGGVRRQRDDGPLTVYSGREEELVEPLFEQFTRGDRHRRRGALRRQRRARGDDRRGGRQPPADVFFAQDPGSLGSVEDAARPSSRRRSLERGRRALPRPRRALGRHLGPLARASSTTPTRCPRTRSRTRSSTSPTRRGRARSASRRRTPRSRPSSTAMRLSAGEDAHATVARGDLKENDAEVYEKQHSDRRGRRPRARSSSASSTTTTSTSSRRSSRTRRSRTTFSTPATRARSSASPAPASSRAPTRRRTPSASSSSCSRTRASASTRRGGGGRVSARRGHRAEGRASRRSTTLQGPSRPRRLRRRARDDARAAERGRLHDVTPRSGDAAPRSRSSSRRASSSRCSLLPLAYLVVRVAGGGEGARASSARARRWRSSGTPRCSRSGSSPRASLVGVPLAWLVDAHRPARRGASGRLAGALPLVIPSYVAALLPARRLRRRAGSSRTRSASSACPRSTATGARSSRSRSRPTRTSSCSPQRRCARSTRRSRRRRAASALAAGARSSA